MLLGYKKRNAEEQKTRQRAFSKKFCVRRGVNEGGILCEAARRAEVSDRVNNKVLHKIKTKKNAEGQDRTVDTWFFRPVLYH